MSAISFTLGADVVNGCSEKERKDMLWRASVLCPMSTHSAFEAPLLVVAVPGAARAIPYKLAHHVGDDVLTVNLACLGTWQTSEASLL